MKPVLMTLPLVRYTWDALIPQPNLTYLSRPSFDFLRNLRYQRKRLFDSLAVGCIIWWRTIFAWFGNEIRNNIFYFVLVQLSSFYAKRKIFIVLRFLYIPVWLQFFVTVFIIINPLIQISKKYCYETKYNLSNIEFNFSMMNPCICFVRLQTCEFSPASQVVIVSNCVQFFSSPSQTHHREQLATPKNWINKYAA